MLIPLEAGADLHARNYHGCALEQAVRCGQDEAVRMLLEGGARAEGTMGGRMSTPLQIAASKGHKTILRILLYYGASINASSHNDCALEQAVRAANYEIVDLLLKRGAQILTTIKAQCFCRSPLRMAVTPSPYMKENFKRSNKQDLALYGAVLKGRRDIVRLLIQGGADVDNVDPTEPVLGSALWDAAFAGHKDIVQLLLEGGANPNGTKRLRPLVAAAMVNKQAVARIFVDHGADTNAAEGLVDSPLFVAMTEGHEDLARWLLEQGADTHSEEPSMTPLTLAISRGNAAMVESILDYRADINAGGRHCALVIAVSRQKDKLIDLLLARGVDVDFAIRTAWQSIWPRKKHKQKIVRRLRRLQMLPQSGVPESQDETRICLLDGRAL
ncbi:unnamed protein product [Aureobasidium pullulans]|nr:unnamed protein product [Aureobasidium pullulans]